MFYILLFLSCMITVEDSTDRTAVTFEHGETKKAMSVRTPVKSSGMLVVYDKDQMLGHGSGNYFKVGKYKFIITAAHVIKHPFSTYIIDGEDLVKIKILYVDKMRDVAILAPERELINIESKTFRPNTKKDLIGKTTYYAGYPQDMDKCLFKGFVSKSGPTMIIMQGFALPGSSGSVVFDWWGRAIGVVSAVKVGFSGVSPFPELVETAVYVERLNFIDKSFIKEIFENDRKGSL